MKNLMYLSLALFALVWTSCSDSNSETLTNPNQLETNSTAIELRENNIGYQDEMGQPVVELTLEEFWSPVNDFLTENNYGLTDIFDLAIIDDVQDPLFNAYLTLSFTFHEAGDPATSFKGSIGYELDYIDMDNNYITNGGFSTCTSINCSGCSPDGNGGCKTCVPLIFSSASTCSVSNGGGDSGGGGTGGDLLTQTAMVNNAAFLIYAAL